MNTCLKKKHQPRADLNQRLTGRWPGPLAEKARGFSLIELLVVISIIGILAALIVPAFNAFNRRQTVKQAAKQLKADLRLTQNRAVSSIDNRGWGVDIVAINQEVYRVRKFIKNEGTGAWDLDPASPKELKLPNDIVFSSAGSTRIVFERLTGIPVVQTTGDPIASPIQIDVQWRTGPSITETVTISEEGNIE